MANPNTLLVERAACPAEWVPLPNGRLGLPLEDGSKKRRVYLATDGKTRLCEHGETPSAISQYAAGSRTRPSGLRIRSGSPGGARAAGENGDRRMKVGRTREALQILYTKSTEEC